MGKGEHSEKKERGGGGAQLLLGMCALSAARFLTNSQYRVEMRQAALALGDAEKRYGTLVSWLLLLSAVAFCNDSFH